MLNQKMLYYTRSMVKIGNLSNKELKFLQQGVVFEHIKTMYFGMDPYVLSKKAFELRKGKNN